MTSDPHGHNGVAGTSADGRDVLAVDGLGVRLPSGDLVHDVSFGLRIGERVGLIGESGSGKSLTALALMGLLPDGLEARGRVALAGSPGNLLTLPERVRARVRGNRMSMVFQEPMSALNPLLRVGEQVAEAIRIHRRANRRRRPEKHRDGLREGHGRAEARRLAVDLLGQVRLPEPERTARAYPHQLSGGQRQRVMIAIALANRPDVLICDEPTSALDVTVQAQILDLITEATDRTGAGLLFISHDLAVVAACCSRVLVMRNGELVESGEASRVFGEPRHPYTKSLVEAAHLGSPPSPRPAKGSALVEVNGVRRRFRRSRAALRAPRPAVEALRGVDLSISEGERFGIVGESGSGKSTLVRLIAALDRPTEGSIRLGGRELTSRSERRLRFVREELQMVFQDPAGSLDPRMTVHDIVSEPLVALGGRLRADRLRERLAGQAPAERVRELIAAVGLPADAAGRYPHQFSGGQRQRISIARALAPRPRVLVADEPVSALDAPIRAQILDLLLGLVETFDLTLILVSHDLRVVRHVCDRVAVLRDGEVVEVGRAHEVYEHPSHPYTRDLLAAVPVLPMP